MWESFFDPTHSFSCRGENADFWPLTHWVNLILAGCHGNLPVIIWLHCITDVKSTILQSRARTQLPRSVSLIVILVWVVSRNGIKVRKFETYVVLTKWYLHVLVAPMTDQNNQYCCRFSAEFLLLQQRRRPTILNHFNLGNIEITQSLLTDIYQVITMFLEYVACNYWKHF